MHLLGKYQGPASLAETLPSRQGIELPIQPPAKLHHCDPSARNTCTEGVFVLSVCTNVPLGS
jgi:hypothetical protein